MRREGRISPARHTHSSVEQRIHGETTRTYNVNGDLVAFVDVEGRNKNRFFANNAQGQVLTAVQGNFDGMLGRLGISQAFTNATLRSGANGVEHLLPDFVTSWNWNTGCYQTGQCGRSDGFPTEAVLKIQRDGNALGGGTAYRRTHNHTGAGRRPYMSNSAQLWVSNSAQLANTVAVDVVDVQLRPAVDVMVSNSAAIFGQKSWCQVSTAPTILPLALINASDGYDQWVSKSSPIR